LRNRDVLLLEPGTPHDYATALLGLPWEFYWAHFLPRPFWLPWLQLPPAGPGLRALNIHNPGAYQRIESAFRRLLREIDGLDAGATFWPRMPLRRPSS